MKHVVRTGNRRGAYRLWWANLRERYHFEELGVEGRIILKFIFNKWIDRAQDMDR